MKKDIEWLKEEVLELQNNGNAEANQTEAEREIGRLQKWAWDNCVDRVYELINQLDEPEITLDKAFEKVAESYSMTKEEIWRHLERLEAHGGKVTYDEPEVLSQELPVIPKFVAEWYESEGKRNSWWNWFYKWGRDESRSDLETKTIKWMQDFNNVEKFVDIFKRGYKVEEEQKYNVNFKVKSSFGTVGIFLYKEGDEVLAGDNFKAYYPKEEECRLTEQEIRGFQNGDILFEHFAVKVEE